MGETKLTRQQGLKEAVEFADQLVSGLTHDQQIAAMDMAEAIKRACYAPVTKLALSWRSTDDAFHVMRCGMAIALKASMLADAMRDAVSDEEAGEKMALERPARFDLGAEDE